MLDFGLAKAFSGEESTTDLANSPTLTVEHTRPGMILGTAAYMSPEQARGRAVDKRTDIWSFGVVLFECLAGSRPFIGETTSDLIARILERDPDWSALPANTPPLVQLLLRRCLAKDRSKRLRDIGDARVDMETTLTDPTSSGLLLARATLAGDALKRRWGMMLVAGVLVPALFVGLALGWFIRASRDPSFLPPVVHFTLDLPAAYELRIDDNSNPNLILNRSGTMLAFTARAEGVNRIFVRNFAEAAARPLPGTEHGDEPFFSPNGRWVGFFSSGKLMKVPVGGGPALTICESTGSDAVWLDDGTILFQTPGGSSIVRVPEGGGLPTEVAVAGPSRRSEDGKQLLLGFQTLRDVPGADYVVAGVWDGTTTEDYALVSVSLTDGAVRPLMQDGVDPYFVAPGHLLFLRGSSILAVPFDAGAGKVTGEPEQVLEGVISTKWSDEAMFAASTSGTIAYIPGGRQGPGRRLIRVDSMGKSEPLMDAADAIVGGLRVSPNGEDILVTTLRRNIDLWSFNIARRSFTLVNNIGETWSALWRPDGQSIVFVQNIPEKPRCVMRKRADGGGAAELVPIESTDELSPNSFSPDGTLLLVTREVVTPDNRYDIAAYHWGQPGPAEVVLGTNASETEARFAPDGKHFAYTSNETGRYEVFVRTLAETGNKWQISQAGGHEPIWSGDGKRLFFLDYKEVLHAVNVDLEAGPQFSAPVKLFDTSGIATTDLWGIYDVLPEGGFVMVQPAEWEKQTPRIHVVLNWRQEPMKR